MPLLMAKIKLRNIQAYNNSESEFLKFISFLLLRGKFNHFK